MSNSETNGKVGPALPAKAEPRSRRRSSTRAKAQNGTAPAQEIEKDMAPIMALPEVPEVAATIEPMPPSPEVAAPPVPEVIPAEAAVIEEAPAQVPAEAAPAPEAPAPEPAQPEAQASAAPNPPGPPNIVWSLAIDQPDWPANEAALLPSMPSMPSSIIYAPDVDKRPMKGLAFDLRAWGYGHILVMKIEAARHVRLNDGRVVECPAGETIVVPVVTDLEALIPKMIEHPDVALEVEFAPVRVEIDGAGLPRVRFRVLEPKVTEIPRTTPALWGASAA